jgi:hypothetical protein
MALLYETIVKRPRLQVTSRVPIKAVISRYGQVKMFAETITDTKAVTTSVGAPKLSISAYKWPASAVVNAVLSNAFEMTVTAPSDADCPNSFCGFVNKAGNPGAVEINIPGVGWTSIAVGNRMIAALPTITKGSSYTYGPRDLKFGSAGTFNIDLIAGVIV